MKALEDAGQLAFGDAHAAVAHPEHEGSLVEPELHLDLARRRELEGVRDQVEDDLLPHVLVDPGRLGERGTVDPEQEARLVAHRPEGGGKILGEAGEIGGLVAALHPARLQAGEVEQGVDHLEQAQGVALGDPQARERLRRVAGALGQLVLEGPEQEREGGAQLVAHVGEEGRLGMVQLGEPLHGGAQVPVGLLDLQGALLDADLELVFPAAQLLGLLLLPQARRALQPGEQGDAGRGHHPDGQPDHGVGIVRVEAAEDDVDEEQGGGDGEERRAHPAEQRRHHHRREEGQVGRGGQCAGQRPAEQRGGGDQEERHTVIGQPPGEPGLGATSCGGIGGEGSGGVHGDEAPGPAGGSGRYQMASGPQAGGRHGSARSRAALLLVLPPHGVPPGLPGFPLRWRVAGCALDRTGGFAVRVVVEQDRGLRRETGR
jgi:hypothetical protein